SPFYGIYFGDNLIARMSLYRVSKKYDAYFEPPQDYLELWKLEVLPDYQGKGYGKELVEYAKSYQLPIKTNPRINSNGCGEKLEIQKAKYEMERDLGENPLIWMPHGVSEKETDYKGSDLMQIDRNHLQQQQHMPNQRQDM